VNRAAFLGAVPLVDAKGTRRGAWIGNSKGMVPQPHRFKSAFMGQFTWPVTGDIGTTPTSGIEMNCYKCGLNPPMLKTPTMASFDPSCVEVDASQCAEQQAEIDAAPIGGGAFQQPGGGAAPTAPNVIASLKVFEPEEMNGLEGADVQVFSVNPFDYSTTPIGSGVTNAQGRYVFQGSVAHFPHPTSFGNAPGNIRFVVTRGDAPYNFSEMSIESRNQGTNTMPSFLVACSFTTPVLVCEVAKGRAMWMTVYAQQIAAWGDSPQGRSNAADWARSAVLNGLKPTDPALQRYFHMTYSWWIGVLTIKPKEWPELTTNHHQTAQIFGSIPFPEWPGIEDYFTRCAAGIPFAIAAGPNAENYNIGNPHLYVGRFSSYFPRSSELIERDMAVAYSDGIAAILNCIIHKIKQKTKEIERSAKAMSMISMGVIVYFAPMLIAAGGVSGFAVLATEAYEFVKMQKEGTGLATYGITAALAVAAIAAGDIDFVVAALEPAIGEAMSDMDPLAQQAVSAAMPQIIDAAADAVLGPQGIGTGLESGGGAVGGAAFSMAVKLIAGIAKNYAANRIEEFQDAVVGAQTAADDVMALVEGREAGPHFKPFIEWVVEALGLLDLFNQAIDDFLDEFYDAFEAGEAQGGGVAVVEEEDGGGLAIVPTDPEGTPTDTEGTPLPGGKAPKTPLKDFEPAAGPSATTAVVGAGGVTALLMVAGGVL
jgi:hypothetical protein